MKNENLEIQSKPYGRPQLMKRDRLARVTAEDEVLVSIVGPIG